MHTEQGVYSITGNYFYDSQPGSEKRLSVLEMPIPQNAVASADCEEKIFHFPTSRKGKISLAVDFVIVIVVLGLIALIEFGIFPHNKSGFYCRDPKISFPFQGDTVTMFMLLITVFVVPLVLITGVELSQSKRNFGEGGRRLWWWYKEFLLGNTVNLVLTEFAKTIVGEPRPHFLDTCRPDTAVNCTIGFVPSYTCTNRDVRAWFVSDSAKSFPSGHASLSVFTAIFCTWYLQRCLPQLSCRLMRPLLQTILLVSAIMCSLSRVTDHRHHWWDVLAGSVLGALCAVYTVVVFCQNFKRPPLSQPRPSHSTCTLLTDTTNKNATSVVL